MRHERCEAIVYCDPGEISRRGEQCDRDATGLVDLRPVCWVHLQAATNSERWTPVRFVEKAGG